MPSNAIKSIQCSVSLLLLLHHDYRLSRTCMYSTLVCLSVFMCLSVFNVTKDQWRTEWDFFIRRVRTPIGNHNFLSRGLGYVLFVRSL